MSKTAEFPYDEIDNQFPNQRKIHELYALLENPELHGQYMDFMREIEKHWANEGSSEKRDQLFDMCSVKMAQRNPEAIVKTEEKLYTDEFQWRRLAMAWEGTRNGRSDFKVVGHLLMEIGEEGKTIYDARMKPFIRPDARNAGYAARFIPLALQDIVAYNVETLDIHINVDDLRSRAMIEDLEERNLVRMMKIIPNHQGRSIVPVKVVRAHIDDMIEINEVLNNQPGLHTPQLVR